VQLLVYLPLLLAEQLLHLLQLSQVSFYPKEALRTFLMLPLLGVHHRGELGHLGLAVVQILE
jgi:hypothetical protein